MSVLFGGQWSAPGENPGFGLIDLDVKNFLDSGSLVGIPITVNHNGLHKAIQHVDATGKTLTKHSFKDALSHIATGVDRIVGHVVSAGPDMNVIFGLNDSFPGLQEMVRSGLFNGRQSCVNVFCVFTYSTLTTNPFAHRS